MKRLRKKTPKHPKVIEELSFEILMNIYFSVQGAFPRPVPYVIKRFLKFILDEVLKRAKRFRQVENWLGSSFDIKEHKRKLFARAAELAKSINDWEIIRENSGFGSHFQKMAEKKIDKLDTRRIKLAKR